MSNPVIADNKPTKVALQAGKKIFLLYVRPEQQATLLRRQP